MQARTIRTRWVWNDATVNSNVLLAVGKYHPNKNSSKKELVDTEFPFYTGDHPVVTEA